MMVPFHEIKYKITRAARVYVLSFLARALLGKLKMHIFKINSIAYSCAKVKINHDVTDNHLNARESNRNAPITSVLRCVVVV